MPDATYAYPMLRGKRRRRWARPSASAWRAALLLAAGAALLLLARAWWWTRPATADPRRLLVEALAALRAGNYNSARDHAQRAAVAQSSAGIANAVLARAYLDLDDGLTAEAALGRAVVAGMPAVRLHQLVAHARLLQGDAEGALAEAAKAEPRYARYAARVRARALAASGQPTAARASLVLLTDAAPTDGEAWTDLGRPQLTVGDIDGASASKARAVRLLPASPRTLTLAGEVVRARFGLSPRCRGSG